MASLGHSLSLVGVGRRRMLAWPRLAGLGVLLIGLGLGGLVDRQAIVTAEAGWRALRATQVWFGGFPSIRSLGYDLPPLPTLLELPLVLLPPLRSNPLAGEIVASLAAVVLATSLFGSLRRFGLTWWLAAALTATALGHPLMLYAIGTGAGDVLALALLLLGLRFLLDWAQRPESVALVAGASVIGLACLARYDLALVAAALTAVVALLVGPAPGGRLAYAIAFGTPAAASLGLWLVLNALATGNPLTFVGQGALALAPPPSAALQQTASGGPLAPFLLMAPVVVLALPGAAATWLPRRRALARPALVLAVAIAAVPLAAVAGWLVSPGRAPLGLLAALPLVPLSVLLLGAMAASLGVAGRWWPAILGLAILGAALPGLPLANRVEWGQGYAAFVSSLGGQSPPPMWAAERAVAAAIREQSQGRDVLVDDRRDALPALLVGAPNHLIATADPDFGAVLSDPRGRARLVLVHSPGGETDPINAAWPRLYAGGVPWAQLVGEWPVSGDPTAHYRLYRVNGA